MEEKDKKYNMGIDAIKSLLAAYDIEDDTNSLSTLICKWLEILLNTHDMVNSKDVSAIYEELLQAKHLQHIFESCISEDITIKAKGFSNMKITNTRLKSRILSLLEGILNDANEIDMLIAQNHFKNMPTDNQQLGFFATSLINHTFKNSSIASLTKSEQCSLVYDLLFKAGKVYRDDCKHEGYNHGGREKFLQVQDWIKAFKKYYKQK